MFKVGDVVILVKDGDSDGMAIHGPTLYSQYLNKTFTVTGVDEEDDFIYVNDTWIEGAYAWRFQPVSLEKK